MQNPGPGPARHRVVRAAARARAGVHRRRRRRRRRAVAALGLPVPPPHAAVAAGGHVQHEQRRRQPHLDRRQGRRRLRHVPASSSTSPAASASRRSCSTTAGRPAPATGAPDSPSCPEPRAAELGHRFPDERFEAVRAELGDMRPRAVDVADALPHELGRRSRRTRSGRARRPATAPPLLTAAAARGRVERGRPRHVEPARVGLHPDTGEPCVDRVHRGPHPPCHRGVRRPLLQVRLPGVARLHRRRCRRTCTSTARRSSRWSTGSSPSTPTSPSRSTRPTTTGCSRSSRSPAARAGSRTARRRRASCCTTSGRWRRRCPASRSASTC